MLALAGILVYIALRFQFSFAVGAVVATLHDLLITLAFLAFFRYDLTLNVIAGLLTITGYSVNDTIVIFDRVRENMRGDAPRQPRARSSTSRSTRRWAARSSPPARRCSACSRSIFFGGEVLKGFAFTMLVGIISGTYSTVFIAAAIAIMLAGTEADEGPGGRRRRRRPKRASRRRAPGVVAAAPRS